MNKFQFAKIALCLSAATLSGSAMAQNADDVIKAKFPEISADLAITDATQYNPALKARYRELFSKFSTGLSEIEKVEIIGANEVPDLEVFDAKTLKDMQKAGSLGDLRAAIHAEQQKISNLMREEKYGADSATCIRLLSTFTEFCNQKAWDDAYNSWTVLFKDYPTVHSSIYTKGKSIVLNKMKGKSRTEQELWIDTLMMVWDQRIKYVAPTAKSQGEAFCLGQKGVDLLKYRKQPVEEPYNILMKSVDMAGKNTDLSVFMPAIQSVVGMYTDEKIDAAVVVEKYLQLSDLLAQKKAEFQKGAESQNASEKEKAEKSLATCDQIQAGLDQQFSQTTAAQCDVLVKAFGTRFKENPNDLDLIEKIVKVLSAKECTDSQLYEDCTVKLVAAKPSEVACLGLAKMLEKKGKADEAIANYEKAIELSTDDIKKAQYNCSVAALLQKKNQFANARTYARKAIELNPNYGVPYIIIAVMYGSSPVGEDAFERAQTYWLVIDKLQKAKAVDPSVASEAQNLINRYSGSCPKKEEAFMHSVTAGKTVTIGGWIGETTTARF
ncbi:MAG: hypothetical protein MJZ61_05310 [Bacteroidales bacterium]|nr:hypothetical protein [Bacteroidales bacterium]